MPSFDIYFLAAPLCYAITNGELRTFSTGL